MTTAVDIISRSMRLIGVYAIGEPLSADESQTGLEALNALVSSLGNSNLLIAAKTLDTVPLTQNQGTYQIGPSGADLVTPRPIQVFDSSTITYQGVDYPLSVWTLQDYNSITIKNIGGTPGVIYPQMDMPNITVSLWPVPGESGMTLNLWSNKEIASFPTLITTVTLPPGWDQMLAYLLAEIIAPEFSAQVPNAVMKEIARIRKNIKRTNLQVPLMQMPYGIPDNNTWVDWRSN